ncbi:MAG: ABC transporter substrate-binding protein [Anaerolineae bacterium]|nr:ABC transporter substrate-binding protein [Anaerolineae bacterium]
MKSLRVLLVLLFVLVLSGVMVTAQEAATACVENYDADVDYFPDKVEAEYSTGWIVEYFNNYKLVTMLTPWPGSAPEDAIQYVLVECGTPVPEGYDNAQVIEIPAGDVIALSTTYLPHLQSLGLLDHLVGMDSFLYTTTPEVIEKIDAGELAEVGNDSTINVEVVLAAEPGLVLAYGNGDPNTDAAPILREAGVPVVVATDYIEVSPLGRAEWIKFVSLFYNAEATANEVFDSRVADYQALVEMTSAIPEEERPLVLWNSYTSFGDAWYIPGSESYAAQIVRDAGAKLVLADDPQVQGKSSAVPFAFEAVYEAGVDADYWVPIAFGVQTLDDLLAQDERYADFAPAQNGTVYEITKRMNANGGNDYFESGVANPQIVLADLVRIFHPDLLLDYEPYYFEALEPAE